MPVRSHRRFADAVFVIGERYILTTIEQRSAKQHARYFALVAEYWSTLPEDIAEQYPSSEHLRKAALCRTGWCDETTIVCATNDEAMRAAILAKKLDSYCVVSVADRVLKVWTAKTQNTKAMDKDQFKASSDAVLTWIECECLGIGEEGRAAA